jgi:hypothetical protein
VWSAGLIELFRDGTQACRWCKQEYPERKKRIAETIDKASKRRKSHKSLKHTDATLSFDNLFDEGDAKSDKKVGNFKPGALSRWQNIKSSGFFGLKEDVP